MILLQKNFQNGSGTDRRAARPGPAASQLDGPSQEVLDLEHEIPGLIKTQEGVAFGVVDSRVKGPRVLRFFKLLQVGVELRAELPQGGHETDEPFLRGVVEADCKKGGSRRMVSRVMGRGGR